MPPVFHNYLWQRRVVLTELAVRILPSSDIVLSNLLILKTRNWNADVLKKFYLCAFPHPPLFKNISFFATDDWLARNGSKQGAVIPLSPLTVSSEFYQRQSVRKCNTNLLEVWIYSPESMRSPEVGLAWWKESNDIIILISFPFLALSPIALTAFSEWFSAVDVPASSLFHVQWGRGVGCLHWEELCLLPSSWQKPHYVSLALSKSLTHPWISHWDESGGQVIEHRGWDYPWGSGRWSPPFLWTGSGEGAVPQVQSCTGLRGGWMQKTQTMAVQHEHAPIPSNFWSWLPW